MVGVVTVAVVTTAGLVSFSEYRPEQQTDDAAAREVAAAEGDGAMAILSYSPGTLQHDFDPSKMELPGDFLPHDSKLRCRRTAERRTDDQGTSHSCPTYLLLKTVKSNIYASRI